VAKLALWILPKGWLVCRGKSQCANAGRHKIELKKSAEGKIKNTIRSAMSVGLLAVQLHYGLYVFCHLSILLNAFRFNVYLSVCLKYGLYGLLITVCKQAQFALWNTCLPNVFLKILMFVAFAKMKNLSAETFLQKLLPRLRKLGLLAVRCWFSY
jgi:hypothetical protein